MRIFLAILFCLPLLGIAGGVYWLRHRNTALCVRCRYPRNGLDDLAPCPECGVRHDANRRLAKCGGLLLALGATVVAWIAVKLVVEILLPLPRHASFEGMRGLGGPSADPRAEVALEWTQWNSARSPSDRFWISPAHGSVTLVLTPTYARTFDLHADIERGVTVVRFGRRECVVDPSAGSLLTLSQWLSSGWPECSVAQATRFAKVITIAGLAAHEETAGNVLAQLQWSEGQPASVFSGVTSSVEPRGGEWREAACLLLATIPGLWLAKIVLRGTHAAPRIGAMTSAGGPDD